MSLLDTERALRSLRKTPVILHSFLKDVDQERAMTAIDGPDGWSVLEALCHLNDFAQIFAGRIDTMLATDHPTFALVDHLALVVDNRYSEQNFEAVWEQYLERRRALVALLVTLEPAAWLRTGVTGGGVETTVLEIAYNVFIHDITHAEQMIRSLGLATDLI